MSQSIALQAENYPINLPGIVNAAQSAKLNEYKLENAPLANEVERLKLEDEKGQQSALSNYRTEAGKTDPVSALPTLNAYPELQSDFDKKIGDLPPEERRKAFKKSLAYAEAAKFVMGFPDGSPEQKQAWNSSVDALEQEGFMDPQTASLARKSGPNKLLLMQAVQAADLVKRYTDPKVEDNARLTDARIGRIDALNAQGDERVDIARKKADGKGSKSGGMTEYQRRSLLRGLRKDLAEARDNSDDQLASDIEAEINDLENGVQEATPNVTQFDLMTAPGSTPQKTADGSQASPYQPATREEAEKLPSGSYFVTPDGTLIRKK